VSGFPRLTPAGPNPRSPDASVRATAHAPRRRPALWVSEGPPRASKPRTGPSPDGLGSYADGGPSETTSATRHRGPRGYGNGSARRQEKWPTRPPWFNGRTALRCRCGVHATTTPFAVAPRWSRSRFDPGRRSRNAAMQAPARRAPVGPPARVTVKREGSTPSPATGCRCSSERSYLSDVRVNTARKVPVDVRGCR